MALRGLALACMMAAVALSMRRPQAAPDAAPVPIVLGLEVEGVSLSLVESSEHRRPKPQRIQVQTKTGSFQLTSLGQLRGLVGIPDGAHALRYVRLRTSPGLIAAWNSAEQQVEIVNRSKVAELPSYHMESYSQWLNSDAVQRWRSGRLGLLSPQSYTKGEFSPPVVESADGGYKIVRWLFVDNPSNQTTHIRRISEWVGKDGSYRIHVLRHTRTPNLPDTTWVIPARR